MKTAVTKPREVSRSWYLIDVRGKRLGRVATQIARLLLGKDKAGWSPSVEMADFVVVINASSLELSGRKEESKRYWSHSGYPGGLKERGFKEIGPVKALEQAVRGMLPKNKLQDLRMGRLKVYAGETHPHEAQQPVEVSIGEG